MATSNLIDELTDFLDDIPAHPAARMVSAREVETSEMVRREVHDEHLLTVVSVDARYRIRVRTVFTFDGDEYVCGPRLEKEINGGLFGETKTTSIFPASSHPRIDPLFARAMSRAWDVIADWSERLDEQFPPNDGQA